MPGIRLRFRVDLADRHGNTVDGVHVASAGGVWGALVHGFAGMRRRTGGRTSFDPRLPETWAALTYEVRAGSPVVVPLDGHGPRIAGKPDALAERETVLADGSVLTQSVPPLSG